jgi:hypothetical protein
MEEEISTFTGSVVDAFVASLDVVMAAHRVSHLLSVAMANQTYRTVLVDDTLRVADLVVVLIREGFRPEEALNEEVLMDRSCSQSSEDPLLSSTSSFVLVPVVGVLRSHCLCSHAPAPAHDDPRARVHWPCTRGPLPQDLQSQSNRDLRRDTILPGVISLYRCHINHTFFPPLL